MSLSRFVVSIILTILCICSSCVYSYADEAGILLNGGGSEAPMEVLSAFDPEKSERIFQGDRAVENLSDSETVPFEAPSMEESGTVEFFQEAATETGANPSSEEKPDQIITSSERSTVQDAENGVSETQEALSEQFETATDSESVIADENLFDNSVRNSENNPELQKNSPSELAAEETSILLEAKTPLDENECVQSAGKDRLQTEKTAVESTELKSSRSFRLSAAAPAIPENEYYRYTLNVSAGDLMNSNFSSLILEVKEMYADQTVSTYEWPLSAEDGWAGSWTAEYRPAGTVYDISVRQAFSTEGESVERTWNISSSPVTVMAETSHWIQKSGLCDGTFQFLFESGDTAAVLAASSESTKAYRVYHYPLITESTFSDSSHACWNVSSAGNHWFLTNGAGYGTLTVANTAKNRYSIVSKESGTTGDYLYSDGRILYGYHDDSSACYYLHFDGTGFITTSDPASASHFSLFQRENAVIQSSDQYFEIRLDSRNHSETTELTVSLSVCGNIADCSQAFPFEAYVDGLLFQEFSLRSGESFDVRGIPVGAEVRVTENSGIYLSNSEWNGEFAGREFIISSMPLITVPLMFTNTLNGDLQVGVPSDSAPFQLLGFLILLFSVIRIFIFRKNIDWR